MFALMFACYLATLSIKGQRTAPLMAHSAHFKTLVFDLGDFNLRILHLLIYKNVPQKKSWRLMEILIPLWEISAWRIAFVVGTRLGSTFQILQALGGPLTANLENGSSWGTCRDTRPGLMMGWWYVCWSDLLTFNSHTANWLSWIGSSKDSKPLPRYFGPRWFLTLELYPLLMAFWSFWHLWNSAFGSKFPLGIEQNQHHGHFQGNRQEKEQKS